MDTGRNLRCDDARLASLAALDDHILLLAENLLGRDLHTEVASRHHDAVRLLEDLVELVQALEIRRERALRMQIQERGAGRWACAELRANHRPLGFQSSR